MRFVKVLCLAAVCSLAGVASEAAEKGVQPDWQKKFPGSTRPVLTVQHEGCTGDICTLKRKDLTFVLSKADPASSFEEFERLAEIYPGLEVKVDMILHDRKGDTLYGGLVSAEVRQSPTERMMTQMAQGEWGYPARDDEYFRIEGTALVVVFADETYQDENVIVTSDCDGHPKSDVYLRFIDAQGDTVSCKRIDQLTADALELTVVESGVSERLERRPR